MILLFLLLLLLLLRFDYSYYSCYYYYCYDYVEDDVRVSTMELSVILLGPWLHLELLQVEILRTIKIKMITSEKSIA